MEDLSQIRVGQRQVLIVYRPWVIWVIIICSLTVKYHEIQSMIDKNIPLMDAQLKHRIM